ncbi:Gfo/Idh/MocA family protein [Novosphingobium sp.]|uniref:Gfo/Idh/MocA family protein n=1 Tax=Novosphingobium sp. TaxID=1874826 RepID=UPI003D11BACE
MTGKTIRWGILGPGGIAREFLAGAAGSATGSVVAVGTRSPEKPELARDFPGARVHDGYEALLADPDVDAIYIATPHPFHAEWAIKAAQAGKHVLCEKPAAMSAAEVEAMFAAATRAGTFLGEAFMYRLHPMTAFILDLLKGGKIGELRLIRSSFGFAIPVFLPWHRLFKPELGGGAILDLGGYPLSIARLIAGYADASDDLIPLAISGFSRNGATGVEEIASANATFANGVIAQMSISLAQWQDNCLVLMGTAGRLEIDEFWFGSGKTGGTKAIRFIPPHGPAETIPFNDDRNVYSFQFEAANAAIASGQTRFSYPGMTEADSHANARALDMWLDATRTVEPPLPQPPLPPARPA